jgi:hypothetical protein
MKRLVYALIVTTGALWAIAFLSYSAGSASAEVDGPCTATFNGVDAGPLKIDPDDAIKVQENDTVVVTFQSSGFASHQVNVSFVDFGSSVDALTDDDDGGDTEWVGNVEVSDWSDYGAGLYKVEGKAELTDGGSCSGAVLIEVDKNPLTTLAGLIAAAVTAVGAASLLGVIVMSIVEANGAVRRVNKVVDAADFTVWRDSFSPLMSWIPFLMLPMVLLTGMTMAAGEGAGGGSGGGVPRASWRPRFSILGITGGLLVGLGVIALLQQYAVLFPDLGVLILALVVGVVLGVVPSSIVRAFAVVAVNRALVKAEARISGGGSGMPAGPGETAPPAAGER